MTIKLYEILPAWQAILQTLEENGGELTPELEAEAAALIGDSKEKLEAAAMARRNLQLKGNLFRAHAKVFMDEAARCVAMAESIEANADRLGDLMAPALEVTGSIQTPAGTLFTQTRTTWAFELKPGVQHFELPVTLWRQPEPELNKRPLADLAESHPLPEGLLERLTAAKALPSNELARIANEKKIYDSDLKKASKKCPFTEEELAAIKAKSFLPAEISAMSTSNVSVVLRAPTAAKKAAATEPAPDPATAA